MELAGVMRCDCLNLEMTPKEAIFLDEDHDLWLKALEKAVFWLLYISLLDVAMLLYVSGYVLLVHWFSNPCHFCDKLEVVLTSVRCALYL